LVLNSLLHIENDIVEQERVYEELQTLLANEQQLRKNRKEYDAMAAAISQLPDRKEQTAILDSIDKELSLLEQKNMLTMDTLDLRNKQFQLLLTSLYSLENELDMSPPSVVPTTTTATQQTAAAATGTMAQKDSSSATATMEL